VISRISKSPVRVFSYVYIKPKSHFEMEKTVLPGSVVIKQQSGISVDIIKGAATKCGSSRCQEIETI
jgi:hypothetical protein